MKIETLVEVAHQLLDDLGIPRRDEEGELNLIGRINLIESVKLTDPQTAEGVAA